MTESNLNINNLKSEAIRESIEKIVVGCLVYIITTNEILLLERASSDFMGGLWELPSGGVDKDETLLQACSRELKEETGISENVNGDYVGHFDYVSGSGKKARQFNFTLKIQSKPVVTLNPEEHSDFAFVNSSEFEEYVKANNLNISEQTKNIIMNGILQNIK